MKFSFFIFVFLLLGFNNLYAQDINAQMFKQAEEKTSIGEFNKSNEILLSLLSKDYMPDLVCYYLSMNYFNLKDYQKAIKYASKTINNETYGEKAALIKGKSLEFLGKYYEQNKFYSEMTQKFPNNYVFYNLKAEILLKQKKTSEAEKMLQNSVLKNKFGSQAHFVLGEINKDKENLTESLLCYYYFLMCETNTVRTKEIICKIAKILNTKDIDRIISEKSFNEISMSKQQKDMTSTILILSDMQTFSQEDSLPQMKTFVENSKTFFSSITNIIEKPYEGFYENFYVDFFSKLLKNNMSDSFLYYSLINVYPNINQTIKAMTKEKMLKFANFLEETKEND